LVTFKRRAASVQAVFVLCDLVAILLHLALGKDHCGLQGIDRI
jgi:hypothetical protein